MIDIDRPRAVGDRIRHTGDVQVQYGQTVLAGAGVVDDIYESVSIRFDLTQEILSVSSMGDTTRAKYRVNTLTGNVNGNPDMPLKPGDSIEVVSFSADDEIMGLPGDLSAGLKLALELMFGATDPTQVLDSEPGSRRARAQMGEKVPIDAAELRSLLSVSEFSFARSTPSGFARLIDIRPVGGIDCYYIDVEVEAGNVGVPGIPSNVRVDKSDLFISVAVSLPVDSQLHERDQEVTSSFAFEAQIADGAGQFSRTASFHSKHTYEYLN